MTDRLRPLWNFEDLDACEDRFRSQLAHEKTAAGRAEVVTQLARIHVFKNEFDAAEQLLTEAETCAGDDVVATCRVHLERGRKLRLEGDAGAALPLFEYAFTVAREAGEDFLAVDAAHMAALAAPDEKGLRAWTQRGLDVATASQDAATRNWVATLYQNLGWLRLEAGNPSEAVTGLEQAVAARERDPSRPFEREVARCLLAKALRAAKRVEEAVGVAERCVAWAVEAAEADGWFRDELAEAYATAGRLVDAAEQARLALQQLDADRWVRPSAFAPRFLPNANRLARLKQLAH